MKTLITFCFALLAVSALASTPTFNTFDTNAFVANASANTIKANTNSGNPNSLVTQAQLSGSTGATNGMTQLQHQQSLASGTNSYSGQQITIGGIVVTNGTTNLSLTGNTIVVADIHQKLASVPTSGGAGVLIFDGVSLYGFSGSPSISAANITSGTLPKSAADATWMPLTNAVAYSNSTGLPVIGNALIIIGTNSFGAILTTPTNWPSGGVGLTAVNTTNSIWSDTNTINQYTFTKDTNQVVTINTNGGTAISFGTNGFNVNTGGSNYLGGINYIQSNSAPYTLATPTGLSTIGLNQGWTNTYGRRADLMVEVFFGNQQASSYSFIVFTNSVLGDCWTNGGPRNITSGGSNSFQGVFTFSDISPNDFGSISNYTVGGALPATITQAKWKLK